MQQAPLILSLDLATVTGWALGRSGGHLSYGSWRLKSPEDEFDRAARNLGCRLRDLFSLPERPEIIVFEEPLTAAVVARMGVSNSGTADFMQTLRGALNAVAGCYGIRTVPVKVQTVRKAFLGRARPDNPKMEVVRHCRFLGFEPGDDNQADAIAQWHFQAGYLFDRARQSEAAA